MTQTGRDIARQLALLLDRQATIDTVIRLVMSIDRRDWSTVRACLGESVALDYLYWLLPSKVARKED